MKTVEKAFTLVDNTLTGGVVANAFIAVAFGASMSRMWSLLNTLQIITHVPLLAIKAPQNLEYCVSMIISIANLSIIPKAWVEKMLSFVQDSSQKLT